MDDRGFGTMKLDFGSLVINEDLQSIEDGITCLILRLNGRFEGFEQGPDGKIWDYFPKLANRAKWIVLNMAELSLYSDVALVLVRKLARELNAAGGRLFLCAPAPDVQAVLDIAGIPYFESEALAVRRITALL